MKLKLDALDMASFFNGLVFFAPVALLVRTMAGVSVSQFFLLQAILSVTIFAGEIPGGIITDRIGYRTTIIINQFLNLLATALLFTAYLSHCFSLFAAEAVVEGIAVCTASGTYDAYLYNQTTEETYLARLTRWGNCSEAGFIVSTLAYGGMYAVGGIPLLLTLTLMSRIIAVVCILRIQDDEPARKKHRKEVPIGIPSLFSTHQSRWVMVTAGCLTLTSILINFFYAEKVLQVGLKPEYLSAIIIAYTLVSMLDEPLLRHLSPAACVPLLIAGGILSVVLMVLFALCANPWLVVGCMILLPFCQSLCGIYVTDRQNRIIDDAGLEERRATALSIMNMVGNGIEIVVLFGSACISGLGLQFWYLAVAGILAVSCGVLVLTENLSLKLK